MPISHRYDERVAALDKPLKLLGELEAGVEPTVREVDLTVRFPSLNDAGWQTAERTGAISLMQYPEVQQLAELYTLQSLFADTLQPAFMAANHAGAMMNGTANPFEMAPATRDALRARVLELKAYLELNHQLGQQLSDGYAKFQ